MSSSLVENECPKCLSVDDFEDLFDKNINCTIVTVSTLLLAPLLSFPTLFYIILII